MSPPKRWLCRILRLGIAANLALAIPTLIAPAWALSLVDVPQPGQLIYARFAAFLVILLSGFYLPAALDPDRYRLVAWFAVLARMLAVCFFVTAAIGLGEPVLYLPALLDLSFFLAQGVLLMLSTRIERQPQAT